MHGNVWEWCLDDYIDNYSDALKDGSALTGGSSTKLLRGGSWGYLPEYCRSAFRLLNNLDSYDNSVGFRVVCSGAART
jgi:formylglycine-generating enzyme required for sulfatase activity